MIGPYQKSNFTRLSREERVKRAGKGVWIMKELAITPTLYPVLENTLRDSYSLFLRTH